jgi:DNA-nicking Smr family endonuclease
MTGKRSDDRALWRRATHDVKRLTPRPAPALPPAPEKRKPAAEQPVVDRRPQAAITPSPPLTLDRFAGIDRANAERLRRGKHEVEARLDLHGLTQAEAHRALASFIRGARGTGKRCVLVITGRGTAKGTNPSGGVLKTAVPRWLNEPEFRPHLLAIATAQPQDGGSGALYVMLRRTRVG